MNNENRHNILNDGFLSKMVKIKKNIDIQIKMKIKPLCNTYLVGDFSPPPSAVRDGRHPVVQHGHLDRPRASAKPPQQRGIQHH